MSDKRSCIEIAHAPISPVNPAIRKEWIEGYNRGKTGTIGLTSAYQMPEEDRLRALSQFSKIRVDELTEELETLETQLSESQRKREDLERLKELEVLFSGPFRLSKVGSPLVKSALSSSVSGNVVYFDHDCNRTHAVLTKDQWLEVVGTAQIFLVEHDWAAAFKRSDMSDDSVPNPYEVNLFEFIINDFHVCYLKSEIYEENILIKTKHGWVCVGAESDDESSLAAFIKRHVRCICVALDAKVAHSEIIREPSNGSLHPSVRKMGDLVYRVVRLSARKTPAPIEGSHETGRRVRLHWRRGHWRHFISHKTWINWMLVGDPDLGFVDKEYRL